MSFLAALAPLALGLLPGLFGKKSSSPQGGSTWASSQGMKYTPSTGSGGGGGSNIWQTAINALPLISGLFGGGSGGSGDASGGSSLTMPQSDTMSYGGGTGMTNLMGFPSVNKGQYAAPQIAQAVSNLLANMRR